jgi:quinol monooxygenase YgiN
MYGTVARLRVKEGMAEQIRALAREFEAGKIPGIVAEYIYRMDADPNIYYMAVVFESKEAYVTNAKRSETDANYRRLVQFLVSEPEWNDGEIVFSLS